MSVVALLSIILLFKTRKLNQSLPPCWSSISLCRKFNIVQAHRCAACRDVPFHRTCHRKAAAQQTHKPSRLHCCNTSHPCIASRAALPAGQPLRLSLHLPPQPHYFSAPATLPGHIGRAIHGFGLPNEKKQEYTERCQRCTSACQPSFLGE